MEEKILDFIGHFRDCEQTFRFGCCYWFALILQKRFGRDCEVEIMHEPICGHFLTVIDGRRYDIRGDVTDIYADSPLESMSEVRATDPKRYARLMRDCRDFIDPEEWVYHPDAD